MTSELFSENALLLSCLWQSSVCIAAGLVVSFLLRHRSSRAHRALFLAIAAAVIVPVMSVVVERFEWGVFVADQPAIGLEAEPIEYSERAESVFVDSIEVVPGFIEEYPLEQYSAAVVAAQSENADVGWGRIVFWGWAAVALVLTARLVVTFLLGVRLLAHAEPVHSEKLRKAVLTAKQRLAIESTVLIFGSKSVCSPVIWCWGKGPVLLVPSGPNSRSRLDWVSVLCHELAHWKRRDHVTTFVSELAVCLLPWHPLLWWAKKRLAALSEQACDDWVVACGRRTTDYAQSLLDLIPQRQIAFAPSVVSNKRGLGGRVRRILQDKCADPKTGLLWALGVSIVTIAVVTAISFAQTRPAQTVDSSLVACTGAIVDADGNLIKGAVVTAYKTVSDGLAGKIEVLDMEQVKTRRDGRFVLGVEPKSKGDRMMFGHVVAAKNGLALGWTNWEMDEDLEVTIELGKGEKLAGVIVDESGKPIARADVRANLLKEKGERKEWLPGISPLDLLGVKSDRRGRFRFNNIPADCDVDLLVTAPGRATVFTYQQDPAGEFEGGAGPKFKAGQTGIEVVLPVEARIEGRVVDANSGQGLTGVEMAVVATFSAAFYDRFVTVSDENGNFSIGGLQSGEYLIRGDDVPRMTVETTSGQTVSDVIIGADDMNRARRERAKSDAEFDKKQYIEQTLTQIHFSLQIFEVTAGVYGDKEETKSSDPNVVVFRGPTIVVLKGHEHVHRLLELNEKREDVKLLSSPMVITNAGEQAQIEVVQDIPYGAGWTLPEDGAGLIINYTWKGIKLGIKGTIEDDPYTAHIEMSLERGEAVFETREDRNGRPYKIPLPNTYFSSEVVAGKNEPFVVGYMKGDKPSLYVVVTPSWVSPEKEPESLLSRPLPDFENISTVFDPEKVKGKKIMVCFWDVNQRPSRHMMKELSKQGLRLREENSVHTVAMQAAKVNKKVLDDWVTKNIAFPPTSKYTMPFPIGMIKGEENEIRLQWGVKSLPWLILTDRDHIVTTEGFGLDELDEKIGDGDETGGSMTKRSDAKYEKPGKRGNVYSFVDVAQGQFVLYEKIPLEITAITNQGEEILTFRSIRFYKSPTHNELFGWLDIGRQKVHDSRWVLTVEVMDAKSECLGLARKVFSTGSPALEVFGAFTAVPLGSGTIIEKARTFFVSLQRTSDDAIISVEGPFEPDCGRPVGLWADTAEMNNLISIHKVDFDLLSDGSLEATLDMRWNKYTDTKWRIGLELFDDTGRSVRQSQTTFVTTKEHDLKKPTWTYPRSWKGQDESGRQQIKISLGKWDEISKASRFRLGIEQAEP